MEKRGARYLFQLLRLLWLVEVADSDFFVIPVQVREGTFRTEHNHPLQSYGSLASLPLNKL